MMEVMRTLFLEIKQMGSIQQSAEGTAPKSRVT